MARIQTYQDLMQAADRSSYLKSAIAAYTTSGPYLTALDADSYFRQQNPTIMSYVRLWRDVNGSKVPDEHGSNQRIACNFFRRLITQRVMYSLGNGVSFVQPDDAAEDTVKPRLGEDFDQVLVDAAIDSLKHSVSYLFWNRDRVHEFPMTEFLPFPDEDSADLCAGARFWRLDPASPMTVVLYEADGYTTYREDDHRELQVVEDKRPYLVRYALTPADGTQEVVGGENYDRLPVVPLWANRERTSCLEGMRAGIDNYDLIKSGFANDLQDCAEIFWLIENAPGMTDEDMQEFITKLHVNHVGQVYNADEARITPYTQQIPHEARVTMMDRIQADLYRDFGALDVHAVAAGATNDHIDAAYQPMDEEAAFFEAQVSKAVRALLALQGIDDSPVFKRSRISNQLEQVQMVTMEAQWLDQATVLRKLPNITPEEAQAIINATDEGDAARFGLISELRTQSTAEGE